MALKSVVVDQVEHFLFALAIVLVALLHLHPVVAVAHAVVLYFAKNVQTVN